MQGLIACVLILGFVSPCLCLRWNVGTKNSFYNVMEFGARGDGKSDDSQAILSAWQHTCGAEGTATMVLPRGKLFMVKNIDLNGPCKAASIRIQHLGEITAPAMDAWIGDKSHWIRISNVNGLTIEGGGLIDGQGSIWWQKCRSCQRPILLYFHACNDLTVTYLNLINSPGGHIGISSCEGARFFHINIHAPGDSPNTDGIDIAASKNILIEDAIIGTGDDCIAINGGCSYINATRVACGPGHGISIGSLGKQKAYETVEEVYVRNCSFHGTQNGARIKTWEGGSGYARKITFEQIIITRAHNPIYIHQHYSDAYPMEAVKLSEVTFRGFYGTSADNKAIILDCSSPGCFNLVFDHINIVSSQPGKKTFASCINAHGTVTSSIPSISCLLK